MLSDCFGLSCPVRSCPQLVCPVLTWSGLAASPHAVYTQACHTAIRIDIEAHMGNCPYIYEFFLEMMRPVGLQLRFRQYLFPFGVGPGEIINLHIRRKTAVN